MDKKGNKTRPISPFGKVLASYRKRRKLSQDQVVIAAKNFDLNRKVALKRGTVATDEIGRTAVVPKERLKLYSLVYEIPYEQLVAELGNCLYDVDFTKTVEVKATRIEDIVPPDELEAYKLLRHLLDTKSREGVLTCLRMIAGDDPENLARKAVGEAGGELDKSNKGVA